MDDSRSLVMYHNDLDGHCSGAIVKYFLTQATHNTDPIMLEVQYGMDLSVKGLCTKLDMTEADLTKVVDQMYIVDFCPTRAELEDILATGLKVYVFDHHVSHDWLKDTTGSNIAVDFDTTKAASEITWSGLFPEMNAPTSVMLTSLYDIWNHENPNVVPWNYGCGLVITDPATTDGFDFWKATFEHDIELNAFDTTAERRAELMSWSAVAQIVNMGQVIVLYKQGLKERNTKAAFDFYIDGKLFRTVNSRLQDSYEAPDLPTDKDYYGICWYYYDGTNYKFSLRSFDKDHDLTEIAERFGGGGHTQAAGFSIGERRMAQLGYMSSLYKNIEE